MLHSSSSLLVHQIIALDMLIVRPRSRTYLELDSGLVLMWTNMTCVTGVTLTRADLILMTHQTSKYRWKSAHICRFVDSITTRLFHVSVKMSRWYSVLQVLYTQYLLYTLCFSQQLLQLSTSKNSQIFSYIYTMCLLSLSSKSLAVLTGDVKNSWIFDLWRKAIFCMLNSFWDYHWIQHITSITM